MKNDQKNVVFDHKRMIFSVSIGVAVAILMVSVFGKLAPVAIVSCKLVSSMVRPFLG